MQVGMGFGALFGTILGDFGTKLGGKLGPSWLQNRPKIDQGTMLKKGLKIASKKVMRAGPGRSKPGGWVP